MSKLYGIGDEEELAEDLQKELPNRIIEELEQIRAEIIQVANEEKNYDEKWALGLRYAVKIIDKYKTELKGE